MKKERRVKIIRGGGGKDEKRRSFKKEEERKLKKGRKEKIRRDGWEWEDEGEESKIKQRSGEDEGEEWKS